MSPIPPTVLYEFEKPRATVRAYITEFRGKRYAHVKEFVEPYDQPGAPLIATKAGICVEISDLDELEACINALTAAIGSGPKPSRRPVCRTPGLNSDIGPAGSRYDPARPGTQCGAPA